MKKFKNQSVTKLKNSICDKNHKLIFRENKNIKKIMKISLTKIVR